MFSRALQRIRTIGGVFFHHFGLHCATHQIRIILVSCVVITSLFYPALDLYYSSSSHVPYLSYLSYVPSLSPFTSPTDFRTTTPLASHVADLDSIWTPHPSLRIQDDAVSRAQCRLGSSIRVERILIQGGTTSNDNLDSHLNSKILLETFDLEARLAKELSGQGVNCLKQERGECLVISPLLFWDYDLPSLESETDIIQALSTSPNVSVSSVPVTPRMVLAGRGTLHESTEEGHYDFDFADYLVITYLFMESDCLGNTEHLAWRDSLSVATTDLADVTFQDAEPELLALQYQPSHEPTTKTFSIISTFTYLAYAFFFAYVTWSMRRMHRVHSRIGLTFTALVEITVSTITSLSVCALVGFKVTMVPWELLPIVIVFLGAENMFNLVDAVTKTSITLAVKDRIAEGLAVAGTSNTLKVVSYNSILGVIAVFSFGAIRQFCVFAIVVLVAHWFLAHTFFLAVLSIDIQRLGLDELLKQGTGSTPVSVSPSDERKVTIRRTKWQTLVSHIQNALRGRARTNLSLFLLLAITAALYSATYSSSTPPSAGNVKPRRSQALARNRDAPSQAQTSHSPAQDLWHVLSPNGDQLLHLRIESPAIVSLKPFVYDDSPEPGRGPRRAISTDSVRRTRSRINPKSLFWLLKIVLLPISATTGALYLLLLYLLKDAELLEAQRHRDEASSTKPTKEEPKSLDGQISFDTLPRGVEGDIDLVAATKDGRLIVCVSVQNEVAVWWKPRAGVGEMETDLGHEDEWLYSTIDTGDLLLRAKAASGFVGSRPQVAIVTAAVAADSSLFALGTSVGVIGVWEVGWSMDGTTVNAQPLSHLSLSQGTPAAVKTTFVHSAPSPGRNAPLPSLLAVYSDNQVVEWRIGSSPQPLPIRPKCEGILLKSMFTHVYPDDRILVIFCMDQGRVELAEVGTSYPLLPTSVVLSLGDTPDQIVVAHASRVELGGSSRLVLGIATSSGSISLWDATLGTCISTFDDVYGAINNLKISPVNPERCELCTEVAPESFSVTFSVGQIVQFFRIYLPGDANHRCSCSRTRNASAWDNTLLGRRSRSSSVSSLPGNLVGPSGLKSNGGSPLASRARLATSYEAAPFPVSGHGIHSRRASEKDRESSRRMSDILTVPIPFDNFDNQITGDSVSPCTTPPAFSWHGATLVRAFADIMCERGGWDVLDGRIAGIRRRARLGNVPTNTPSTPSLIGLSAATLERWEVWVLDPSHSNMRSSPLVALATPIKSLDSPRSLGQAPRLPFTRVSPFVSIRSYGLAGFGNTLGLLDFSSFRCQTIMDLFLVPNNVENAVFVSSSGDPCYEIITSKTSRGEVDLMTSEIQRIVAAGDPTLAEPEDGDEAEERFMVVAEVDWKSWSNPTIVRSPIMLAGGKTRSRGESGSMKATDFLFKQKRFSRSRCFRDGGETYCWKHGANGFLLLHKLTKTEIARCTVALVTHGVFAGEKKLRLTIHASVYKVNVDMIVLSFIILEKKRRDAGGDGTKLAAHDEDPQGDGCAEGGE
ncbi:hypothetical protein EYR40_001398 [Pleurotus pulmonarius]|nr:hypothetical protein EYR38_004637 [Pleurotus pulmonarius]KAF4609045.1 hypothetical protein EYR40_001398 [Pleurotus pulmonarius]